MSAVKHTGCWGMSYNVICWMQTDARNARANQVKLDADQLERLLFQLFEGKVSCVGLSKVILLILAGCSCSVGLALTVRLVLQPSWKMNDLRAETRQSVESIKKILEKIAVQITRGPSRGEYELRSEYRTTEASAIAIS